MKIAYNPLSKGALQKAPNDRDITFDLPGKTIYALGVKFEGTDTKYSVFKKDTSEGKGGYNGLVPKPNYNSNSKNRYLREDGTWVIPTDIDNKVLQSISTTTEYRPLILGYNHNNNINSLNASVTNQVYTTTEIYAQPSTGSIFAKSFVGNLKGIADIANSVEWLNIKNRPSTFPSSPHEHFYLSNWVDTRNDKTIPQDYGRQFKIKGLKDNNVISLKADSKYSNILGFRGSDDVSEGVAHELAFVGNGDLYRRYGSTTDWDSQWIEFIDSHNYTKYTVTKTGGGASGNWHIKSDDSDKLDGHDSSEFLLKKEVLNNNLITIKKSIKLSKEWLDTGIILNSATFPNGKGSYLLLVSRGMSYIWTGYCTLNIDSTASNDYSDEILLHGGGFDSDSLPYLRTINDKEHNNIKLLMAYTKNREAIDEWIFKFKRLI